MSDAGSDELQPARPDAAKRSVVPGEAAEFEKLQAELARLKTKLAETKDKDIISVLSMRIQQIEAALPPELRDVAPAVDPAKQEEEAALQELENIQPPTPKEAEEAEKLIRQARLEKQRGNAPLASSLIKKASDVAPGSPVVLEALGDDYAARKLSKQARATYKKALSLDPRNVGLERKYAEIVLLGAPKISFEEQMRMGDSVFMTGDEHLAASWAVLVLSGFLPGVGQMVVGKTVKGFVLLVLYAICFIWIAIMHQDFSGMIHSLTGHRQSYNSTIFIPLAGLPLVWLVAMGDLMSKRSSMSNSRAGGLYRPRGPIDRPRPPVDLPFE